MCELQLSILKYIGVHGFVDLTNRKCDFGGFPVEAQIMQKLKNNEARPKFTASYKKVPVYYRLHFKNN